MKKSVLFFTLLSILIFIACSNMTADKTSDVSEIVTLNSNVTPSKKLSEEFKKYWYSGEAEISSYALEQARYGEIRNGHAVLIYVTEDFLPQEQVKADYQNNNNVPVLKLNATKKFNTGVYPYSIMQSTFYPVSDDKHAIKVSSSMQEWCGHVYTQLNNRKQFDIISHSYFEGEADKHISIPKELLENEIWTKIRINPENLPIGNVTLIPSFEYIRLRHKEIKAYQANISLEKGEPYTTYTLSYPDLNRTLSIVFNTSFPHEIERWSETFKSGFGPNARELTTRATKIKSIKSSYWNKNANKDEILRDTLGLK